MVLFAQNPQKGRYICKKDLVVSMKRFLLLALCIALYSCQKDVPTDPFDAEQLVNLISTNDSWQEEYSDANITTETRYMDEYQGERTIVTLYPQTLDELVIIYNGNQPQELYWNKSGQWKTASGTVGQPIEVLEKANQGPLSFYGLGYDLPGKVKIDSGLLANKNITYAVRPTADLIPSKFYGYDSFETQSQEVKDLKLFITRVQIDFPEGENTPAP